MCIRDRYKNYWLPNYIVKESTNVLSLGVHRDVGFEQAMLKDNPNLNIHCYDPTPDSVKLFETDFEGKKNMTFHQVAYAKDNGKMKFYYDKNDLSKCYSLLPLPQFGEEPAYIDVPCKYLTTIMQEDMPQVDIIKADIESTICSLYSTSGYFFDTSLAHSKNSPSLNLRTFAL